MYRNALIDFKNWFFSNDSKPLILRGARQVGKTTLIRLFAAQNDLTLIEVNMEDPQSFVTLLKNNQPQDIFEILALERGLDELSPDKHLFFFDEVQECPDIIRFLRYCYERAPDFRVVCAGSLLEFTLGELQTSFPVGRVEYMYLETMTFEEYLRAVTGSTKLVDKLENFSPSNPISQAIHTILLNHFKSYLICGGMPEVVSAKAKGKGLLEMEKIKSAILESYYSDFPKYTQHTAMKPDIALLQQLFSTLPNQIGNKITYSKLALETKAEKVKRHIDFLEKALLVKRCIHSSANEPPLRAGINEKVFKLLGLDVGLLQTQLGVSIAEIIDSKDVNKLAKGDLTEQFIGQHLSQLNERFKKPALYHWSRQSRGSEAEVDYLIELNGQIIPIEVKAGTSNTMRSLQLLQQEKHYPFAVRFYAGEIKQESRSIPDQSIKFTLLSLPLYAVGQLPRLFAELSSE